ncbi:hypothetical protein ABIB75_005187 [Bradyrhizobium sp. GM2.2]
MNLNLSAIAVRERAVTLSSSSCVRVQRHSWPDRTGRHPDAQYPDPDRTDQGNRAAGLDDYHAVIEATVQRTRPVILTALAAVLAFIPLTHSVFWGSMAYTLIGGTAVGKVLILLFLPALYVAWFRIKPAPDELYERSAKDAELRTAIAAE